MVNIYCTARNKEVDTAETASSMFEWSASDEEEDLKQSVKLKY